MYAKVIATILEQQGVGGKYQPADIEAWMRLEHPTLDAMPAGQFAQEVMVSTTCIDMATPAQTARLRRSYGL